MLFGIINSPKKQSLYYFYGQPCCLNIRNEIKIDTLKPLFYFSKHHTKPEKNKHAITKPL